MTARATSAALTMKARPEIRMLDLRTSPGPSARRTHAEAA
jgi:hypothetical protein